MDAPLLRHPGAGEIPMVRANMEPVDSLAFIGRNPMDEDNVYIATGIPAKAKSAVVAQFVRIARKARLGYDDFLYISQQARKKLGCAGDAKSAGCLSCLPMPI
jgi:hypothetical protein